MYLFVYRAHVSIAFSSSVRKLFVSLVHSGPNSTNEMGAQ